MPDVRTPSVQHVPADRPAHYRLSTDTWELILKEYREGATAPFLARKWRVSVHAVRARITRHKATKRDWGDAQAIEQAVAREAELEEARRNSPEAVAARLFDGVGALGEDEADDPAVLARVATLASGRAMRGRLWAEARALAGLAESYARMHERVGGGGGSIETMRLDRLMEIVFDRDGRVTQRFSRRTDGRADPEAELKDLYWRTQEKIHGTVNRNLTSLMLRAVSAERLARELGGEPKVSLTDAEIDDWAREWMSGPPTEANVQRRTHLAEWPWR